VLALAMALAGSACLWIGVASSGAADPDALRGQINSARQQAQGLAAKVQTSGDRAAGLEAKANGAAEREQDLMRLLTEGRKRVEKLAGQIDAAESRLDATRSRLQGAIVVLRKRLVAIYKGEGPDALNVILDSEGFEDLATRSEYLRLIENSDASLATRVRSLRDEIADGLASLRELRDQAEAYNARIDTARRRIAAARVAAAAQAAALARARAAAAGSLDGLRGQISAWEAELERTQQISHVEAQRRVAQWVGKWAIPEAVVMCESGGNYRAVNGSSGAGGAYQIMPSTWSAYGGKGRPQDASKAQQDRIAAAIWRGSGPSAWVCAQ
jgi:predicted  nucleic acid-binding Zn-ribbon protein